MFHKYYVFNLSGKPASLLFCISGSAPDWNGKLKSSLIWDRKK